MADVFFGSQHSQCSRIGPRCFHLSCSAGRPKLEVVFLPKLRDLLLASWLGLETHGKPVLVELPRGRMECEAIFSLSGTAL